MDKDKKEQSDYEHHSEEHSSVVPGRLTLDDLHREQEELKQAKEATTPKQYPKVLNAMSMISVGIDFAVIIAAPLIILIFLGKYLDEKQGTKIYVLFAIPLALAISTTGIYKQIQKLKDKMK